MVRFATRLATTPLPAPALGTGLRQPQGASGSPGAAARRSLRAMPPRESPGADAGPTVASAALSRRIESMVAQWSSVIQRAARQYGLAGAEVDEVTQDVRVRLWNLLEREDPATEVSATYAWRAATSAAIDLVRRDRLSRHATMVAIEQVPQPPAPDDVDLLERLEQAVQQLQRSRRVAVRLHLDGATLDEVARTLGWTNAQARNQVYRGLADLKRVLSHDGETGA